MTAGSTPQSAADVNTSIGFHLRQFVETREIINHDFNALAALDLKAPPYNMIVTDETDIKSAINGLNAALQAVDMTFINRLTGLF